MRHVKDLADESRRAAGRRIAVQRAARILTEDFELSLPRARRVGSGQFSRETPLAWLAAAWEKAQWTGR